MGTYFLGTGTLGWGDLDVGLGLPTVEIAISKFFKVCFIDYAITVVPNFFFILFYFILFF